MGRPHRHVNTWPRGNKRIIIIIIDQLPRIPQMADLPPPPAPGPQPDWNTVSNALGTLSQQTPCWKGQGTAQVAG